MTEPPIPEAPSSVPVGVDPSRASIARVYDAALGGKDNYEIDRQVFHQIQAVLPASDTAWANRIFLIRVVRFLTDKAGIDQFIDCGSGLPSAENTHQAAQRVNRDARVIYVDNDPVVLAHGNALLAENANVHIADADIFVPQQVYGHPLIQKHIDWTQPVALLHLSTMHHYPSDDYARIMRDYIERLPSGSYVALSHFYDPEIPELTAKARHMEQVMLNSPMGSGTFRTRAQLFEMMEGLEILPPGRGMEPDLVVCDEWWPDGPKLRPLNVGERLVACLVGRKP